jgi:hypothetical protein
MCGLSIVRREPIIPKSGNKCDGLARPHCGRTVANMEDDLDAVYIALEKLRLERAALLAERRHLLQERGGG